MGPVLHVVIGSSGALVDFHSATERDVLHCFDIGFMEKAVLVCLVLANCVLPTLNLVIVVAHHVESFCLGEHLIGARFAEVLVGI